RPRLRLDDHRRHRLEAPEAAHRLQPRRRHDGDPDAAPGARLERVPESEGVASGVARDHRQALLLRRAGVRSEGGSLPGGEFRPDPDRARHRLSVRPGRHETDGNAGEDRLRPGHPRRHHIVERAPLPRIAGSTSLIEPDSTASAASSYAFGCALPITMRAQTAFAMSTAPATG